MVISKTLPPCQQILSSSKVQVVTKERNPNTVIAIIKEDNRDKQNENDFIISAHLREERAMNSYPSFPITGDHYYYPEGNNGDNITSTPSLIKEECSLLVEEEDISFLNNLDYIDNDDTNNSKRQKIREGLRSVSTTLLPKKRMSSSSSEFFQQEKEENRMRNLIHNVESTHLEIFLYYTPRRRKYVTSNNDLHLLPVNDPPNIRRDIEFLPSFGGNNNIQSKLLLPLLACEDDEDARTTSICSSKSGLLLPLLM